MNRSSCRRGSIHSVILARTLCVAGLMKYWLPRGASSTRLAIAATMTAAVAGPRRRVRKSGYRFSARTLLLNVLNREETGMDLGLAGKKAIISGGSRGIGRAVAKRLLIEGASVAFFARDQETIDATVADLGQYGRILGQSVDAADFQAVGQWVDSAARDLEG